MEALIQKISAIEFGWIDVLDILLVAFLLYSVLVLIRGTRAMQMLLGLLFLAATRFVAQELNLLALDALSAEILFYLPFAIIVLFQHEIRRALAQFGRNPLLGFFSGSGRGHDLSAVVKAADELARRKIGALIVLERTQQLRMYTDGGRRVDALLSAELLVTIFVHDTPLHDGAVVIEEGRIVAAGVFLPLTASSDVSRQYGTRHRAALGLSEETDAFTVVVSEENGTIGVALDGVLYENLEPSTLSEMIRIHVTLKGPAR